MGLIGWLILGGLFAPRPDPVEMTQVSVISGADFDALMAAQAPPQRAMEVVQPAPPEEVAAAPEAPQAADEATETPQPPEPQPEDIAPGDIAVLTPEVAQEAAPRPIERVAPEPVAQPEPEARPDPVEQAAVAPEAEAETAEPEAENQEATAPEEATTQIVTEATAAPARSTRPPGRRPEAPVVQAAVEEDTAPAETDASPVSNDDVLAALQAAQDTPTPAPAAPSGPPLSAGEKDALRVAVSRCWNIGSLSTEALGTIIIVGLEMNQNGTPVTDSIRMISASGGSSAAAQRVFDTARRAIIRCGGSGFNLPAEKFGQWQKIEMTFDPSKMGF